VAQLVREVAFTQLNRLAAYKLMERRGLIREAVSRGLKSQGFLFYLADHPADERLWSSGRPEVAYRHFLEWLGGTLSEEIGVLFAPDDPANRLLPPQRVLDRALDWLNSPELDAIWGDDETIGWIYQYFTPKELREQARKESQAPRNSYELAFRNQFYTPRYVVEFLTDNTLGRTWYEMRRGDTALVERCRYLVRRKHPIFLAPGQLPPEQFVPSRDNMGDPDLPGEMWVRPNPDLESLSGIWHYALTVGGYHYARQQLGVDCAELANRRRRQYGETGVWEGTFEELRCCLFFEQRRYHHFGEDPEGDDLAAVRALHAALCERWNLEADVVPHRPKKDPRQLKILDPACGSGHFLLYCFDLLEVIYLEAYADPELGPALQRDYATPAELQRALPGLILRHNLHGIDIDRRAVQIASLALWLRAQRAYQALGLKGGERPPIERANIVCAEPMPGDAALLDEFAAGLRPKVLGQLLRAICRKMELAGEAGSLLKIEEEIREAVSAARRQWLAGPKPEQLALWPEARRVRAEQLTLFDLSDVTDEAFWQEAEGRLLEALEAYARRAENGGGLARRLFGEDAAHGFAFIDLCRQRYDVVLMNPPFGLPTEASNTVSASDPLSQAIGKNLAWAFVARWLALTVGQGIFGAIVDRTIFQKSSYEAFREDVVYKFDMESFLDLGFGVLDDANVFVACFTVANRRAGAPCQFVDLRQIATDERRSAAMRACKSIAGGSPLEYCYYRPLNELQVVPFRSLAYQISKETLHNIFQAHSLGDLGVAVGGGLQCNDVFRFVRLVWEVHATDIGRDRTWVNFYNGGDYSLFWTQNVQVVDWKDSGKAIKDKIIELGHSPSRHVVNENLYFLEGLAGGERGEYFDVHCLPEGMIFSNEGRAFFSTGTKLSPGFLLGYLNTTFAQNLVNVYCGQHKGSDYLKRLPMPESLERHTTEVEKLALDGVGLKRCASSYDETSLEFWSIAQLVRPMGQFQTLSRICEAILNHFESLDYALVSIISSIREHIQDSVGTIPLAEIEGIGWTESSPPTDSAASTSPNVEALRSRGGVTAAVISLTLGCVFGRWDIRIGLNPSLGRKLGGPFQRLPSCCPETLVSSDGLPATSGTIVSEEWLRARPNAITPPPEGSVKCPTIPDTEYPLRISWEGILPDDPDHPDDVVRRVREVLELLWGERAEAIEREACDILGVPGLRDYFRKPAKGGFWLDHVQRYSKSRRKAPIYWLLQSSKKNYALWLYYHRLDKDLLFKALVNYVEPKLRLEEGRLAGLRAQRAAFGTGGREAKQLDKDIERQEALLTELEDFRDKLRRAADLGLEPDLNDGVVLNIAPLWELVPWREARQYWEELLAGKYEWSSIGNQLREKGLVK
jgi:hypothetical protein